MNRLFLFITFIFFQSSLALTVNQFLNNREIFVTDRDIQVLSEANATYPKEKRQTVGALQSLESKASYIDKGTTIYSRYRVEVQRPTSGKGVAAISEAMVKDFGTYINTSLTSAHFGTTQNLTSRTLCDSRSEIKRGLLKDDKKVSATCSTYTKYFCELYRDKAKAMENFDKITAADLKKCSGVMDKLSDFFRKFKEDLSKNKTYSNAANAEKDRMQDFAKRSIEKVGIFKDSYVNADVDKEEALTKHLQIADKSWNGWTAIYEFEKLKSHCDEYFPQVVELAPTIRGEGNPAGVNVTR